MIAAGGHKLDPKRVKKKMKKRRGWSNAEASEGGTQNNLWMVLMGMVIIKKTPFKPPLY